MSPRAVEENTIVIEDRAPLYPTLERTVVELIREAHQITQERNDALQKLGEFVRSRTARHLPTRLIFICTHNSRRSHMAQIWAQTAAAYFGVPGVETYSGGTEVTAFSSRAVEAMERAGFQVKAAANTANPIYEVRYGHEADPIQAFSKVYDQPPNPTAEFAAVMTCSQADAACPLVLGASERFAITYEDPKAFDGTDREFAAYDERCRQIAREMLFVFSRVGSGHADRRGKRYEV